MENLIHTQMKKILQNIEETELIIFFNNIN